MNKNDRNSLIFYTIRNNPPNAELWFAVLNQTFTITILSKSIKTQKQTGVTRIFLTGSI